MKTLYKAISFLFILLIIISCDDEESKNFGEIGIITISTQGNLQSAPTTVIFTATAENAEFFIWNFDYEKTVNGGETTLPMGAEGEEVEVTIEEKGVYTVKVTAYNGDYETKTSEIEVIVYNAEEDIDINTTSMIHFNLDRNLCTPETDLSFDVNFELLDPNSLTDIAYVVRKYSSVSHGEIEMIDTLDSNTKRYQYTTQAALLESFDLNSTLVEHGDAVNYKFYIKADNGETYLLDEVDNTVIISLMEPVILPTGNWTATNNITGFSKTVELQRPSPFQTEDDGRYWLSDFGLDWSNWYDWWYTVEFKIRCPEGADPRYIIDLFGSGSDTGTNQTDTDRFGTEVTKLIRVMPYIYSGTKVGYYDPSTETITFKDVPLTDAWWSADNHTVDLTFTYQGK